MFDHDKKRQMVTRSADLTQEARELSERDRDYYDNKQWTVEEMKVLQKRKQPVITINRIQRKVDAMVGIEQKGRVDPVAYPRNPNDEGAADIATKALRYVEECERIDVKRTAAFENLLIEGYGGVEVVAEERRGQAEVVVRKLRWEEIFYDPHSREKDFSDAGFVGVQKWMSENDAFNYLQPFWDGDEDELSKLLDTQSGDVGSTYEDRPVDMQMAWVDKKLRRVRVAQMYYRYGDEWRLSIFTGKGEIYDEASPWLDEEGKPGCGMILMSAYVDRDNQRYGMVRGMISAQDEVNKRRSKLLHQLNSRQTYGKKGVVSSVAALKRELAQPDGHIEIDGELLEPGESIDSAFRFVPQSDQIQGQASLLAEAKNEIDMVGPNASLLGQLEGQQSGRAIMAQQQAGLAELAPIYDSLRDWTERVYRAVWMRIRQFWTAPRWIRITEEEDAPQFIGLNQPVMDPYGNIGLQNPVAQIDVDIIVSMAPEYVTLRHEQFDRIADMMKAGVPIPPQVMIELADIPDKKRIREMMKGDPQQAEQQAQLQQMVEQLQLRLQQAEVSVKETQAEKNHASAQKDMASIAGEQQKAVTEQARTGLEATKQQIAAYDAQTKRMSALRPQPSAA